MNAARNKKTQHKLRMHDNDDDQKPFVRLNVSFGQVANCVIEIGLEKYTLANSLQSEAILMILVLEWRLACASPHFKRIYSMQLIKINFRAKWKCNITSERIYSVEIDLKCHNRHCIHLNEEKKLSIASSATTESYCNMNMKKISAKLGKK